MRARYINISIHEDLAKKIDEYIKSQFGTLSIGELVGLALASIVILLFISAIIYGIVKLFRGRKK